MQNKPPQPNRGNSPTPSESGSALPTLPARALESVQWERGAANLTTLDEADAMAVRSFAATIDPTDAEELMVYGAAEQGRMHTWLDVAVDAVVNDDRAPGEQAVSDLLGQLKAWDALCAPRRGLFGGASLAGLKTGCRRMLPIVEELAGQLLVHSVELRKMIKLFERMAVENALHHQRLTTYLLCGQVRLQQLEQQNQQQAAHALDIRLHDIALTRQVSLQTQAQLALLTKGNQTLIDTIERTLAHTLPLWKAQVLVTLGIAEQTQAARDVTDVQRTLQKQMRQRQSLLKRLVDWFQGGVNRAERERLRTENMRVIQELSGAEQQEQTQNQRAQGMNTFKQA